MAEAINDAFAAKVATPIAVIHVMALRPADCEFRVDLISRRERTGCAAPQGIPAKRMTAAVFGEPYPLKEPKCQPDFVAAQVAHRQGGDAGVRDTLIDIAETLREISKNLGWVTRLGVLTAGERFGTVSGEEQIELPPAVEDRIDEISVLNGDPFLPVPQPTGTSATRRTFASDHGEY